MLNRFPGFLRKTAAWLLAAGLCLVVQGLTPAAAGAATLVVADCVKCHAGESAEIAARGRAHGSELDCQACHADHRPRVASNIPACSDCHGGAPHYRLQGCQNCHNPHAPLDITLQGDLKEVCLSCHAEAFEQLLASKTRHRELGCAICHKGQHKTIPACADCHGLPHADGLHQKFPQCGGCHGIAHDPNK